MFPRLLAFWRRHPALRDAVKWALPALAFGLLLRLCLLSYSPLAYWGSDSRSYFDFTYKLFHEHYISLVEKRRFLYPIFVAVVSLVPGTPLRWLALVQHTLGLLTLVPIAYILRKTTVGWRWWIVPLTLLYAGMPVLLWYEHELLAETILFDAIAWAFAGWVAWAGEEQKERAARLWWLFLVPFAIAILMKPSARFFWPGIALGLLYVQAWRKLKLAGLLATLGLIVATLFVGSKNQGAWLMYTASFPLTQLEAPKNAEYKAQIREDVEKARGRIDHYFREDDWAFSFLENPRKQTDRPLWTALEGTPLKTKLYMELALEGIKTRPDLFLLLGRDRLVASANLSTFKEVRFTAANFPTRFADDYQHALDAVAKGRASYEAMALGLPKLGPLPPYEGVAKRLAPVQGGWPERFIVGWVKTLETHSDFVRWPAGKEKDQIVRDTRPTLLGWYMLLALAAAFCTRGYRRTHAVWVLGATSYICGVFLVSQVNPRYFGAAWPVFLPALVLPLDWLLAQALQLVRRQAK